MLMIKLLKKIKKFHKYNVIDRLFNQFHFDTITTNQNIIIIHLNRINKIKVQKYHDIKANSNFRF